MAERRVLAGVARRALRGGADPSIEGSIEDVLLVTVTERRTKDEIDHYVAALKEVLRVSGVAAPGGRAASAPLMGHESEPTLFEMSVPGRSAYQLRTTGVPRDAARGARARRSHLNADVVAGRRGVRARPRRATSRACRTVSSRSTWVCIRSVRAP